LHFETRVLCYNAIEATTLTTQSLYVGLCALLLVEVGEHGRADSRDGEPRRTDERPQRHNTARVPVLTTVFIR